MAFRWRHIAAEERQPLPTTTASGDAGQRVVTLDRKRVAASAWPSTERAAAAAHNRAQRCRWPVADRPSAAASGATPPF